MHLAKTHHRRIKTPMLQWSLNLTIAMALYVLCAIKRKDTLGDRVGSLLLSILADLIIQFGEWLKSLSAPARPSTTPSVPLTPYRQQIKKLWNSAVVDLTHTDEITRAALSILQNKARYEKVSSKVNGVPWYVIGAIHMRESSFNFALHLANGDPLFNASGVPLKTTHVPAGLGPFTDWECGAVAALKHVGFDKGYHWDLVNALENLEVYNGLGYKRLGVPSPYVWSKTNQYKSGKYVADHVYDATTVDKQIGCAAVLMTLKSHGVDLNEA